MKVDTDNIVQLCLESLDHILFTPDFGQFYVLKGQLKP